MHTAMLGAIMMAGEQRQQRPQLTSQEGSGVQSKANASASRVVTFQTLNIFIVCIPFEVTVMLCHAGMRAKWQTATARPGRPRCRTRCGNL